MIDGSEDVFAVLVVAEMVEELEAISRLESTAKARSIHKDARGVLFLHADLGQSRARVLLGVLAGEVVDFELARIISFRGITGQIDIGILEIEILQYVFPRPNLLAVGPFGDGNAFWIRAETSLLIESALVKMSGLIPDYQLVLFFSVAEIVENTIFLHQTRDKIEIGLAVLHTVFAFVRRLLDAVRQLDVCGFVAVLGENLLQNIHACPVLENPAVALAGEKPERRHECRKVLDEGHRFPVLWNNDGTTLSKRAENAVDLTKGFVLMNKCNRGGLPDDRFEIYGGIRGEHHEIKVEETGNSFMTSEAPQEEIVIAQVCALDADQAVLLRKIRQLPPPGSANESEFDTNRAHDRHMVLCVDLARHARPEINSFYDAPVSSQTQSTAGKFSIVYRGQQVHADTLMRGIQRKTKRAGFGVGVHSA